MGNALKEALMDMRPLVILALGSVLGGCISSYTHTDKAAELVNHPLRIASGGYIAYTGDFGGIFAPHGYLILYLYDSGTENMGSFDRCAPASLDAYRADLAYWQNRVKPDRPNCLSIYVTALPKGTLIQVDSVLRTPENDNGTEFSIEGHLLDTKLGTDEFKIDPHYFVLPGPFSDGVLHLDPRYFTAQAP